MRRLAAAAMLAFAIVPFADDADADPPTEISTCGTNVFLPGKYLVTEDLNCSGDGITVTADNVTIDLGGHELHGDNGADDFGITGADRDDLHVTNGNITRFDDGIHLT